MGRAELSRGRENPRVRPEGERADTDRVPLHEQKSKLGVVWADASYSERYVARWVNEEDQFGARPPRFQMGGWEYVPREAVRYIGAEAASHTESGGSFFRKQVGIDIHGKPLYARFMWIKREWYDEDQQAKQAKIDAVEGQIKRTLEESDGDFYGDVNVVSRLHRARKKI